MSQGETLGCGVYEVYFRTRGGDRSVCRARNVTNISWSRTINDVSSAEIKFALNGTDPTCCACYGSINPWEHEISIYRDGQEVWCGPVVNGQLDLAAMSGSFEARDLSAWFDHRWVEIYDNEQEFEEVDVSVVYDWLIAHAYYQDPWNMYWNITQMGVPIDRSYFPFSSDTERWGGTYPNIGAELRQLSEFGIDYTTVGRAMIGGDLEGSTRVQARLTDRDWETLPTISIIGTGMATEVGVGGGNGGYEGWYDDQIWIERPDDGAREQFGLLQTFFPEPTLDEEDTTNHPNAITQQAYALRELKKRPFVYLKGGSLSSKAAVTFGQLIPGRLFQISLGDVCRPIEDLYRLTSVRTDFDGESESVAVELTPLGADALRTP